MIGSTTLFRYISLMFSRNILMMLAIILGLVFIIDALELMRRGANQGDVPFTAILGMAGLKLADIGQRIIPFSVMFAGIYTCWRLNKTSELVVIRAAGLSAWQFLGPMLAAAFAFGILATTILNPLSAGMIAKYNRLESIYLNKSDNIVTIARTGIWLKQPAEGGYALFHAGSFDQRDWRFSRIIIFFFDQNDGFIKRIDADSADLKDGYWQIYNAVTNEPGAMIVEDRQRLPTNLTASKLQESFSNPDTVSFWKMNDYLRVMAQAGFPTSALEIHFQSLLARPLMLVAMVLLAAAFSLRPSRFGGQGLLIALGVGAGFFIFFMESMLHAFGISEKIPAVLAAWTPALVSLLLGATALLHLEDG